MTGSLLDGLREKRAAAAKRTTVDIPVPGYGGDLVARYRLLDPLVEGKVIGERIQREFSDDESRGFYALVDTLLMACEGLFMRGDAGALEPIDPDELGVVTYEHRLAEGLGFEATTSRDVLLGVFNGNKVAVTAHAISFQNWMQDPAGSPLGEA